MTHPRILRGVDVSALVLCRGCTELHGDLVLRTTTAAVQRCACERPDHDEPDWLGFDFNSGAELCSCCCREVIRTGSKWSSYFCEDCRRRVVALNSAAGRCIVPLGRHSLMTGAAPDGSRSPADESVARFARDLRSFFERCERLGKWKEMNVQRVLAAIPGDGSVPLEVYFPAARRVMRTKVGAFRALLDWWA